MAESETGLGFPPPHPGEVLKEDVLPEFGMTVEAFARHLGVKRASISELVNEKRSVSQDMAVRLGKALRTGTRYWLALQLQYDLWRLERDRAPKISVAPLPLPDNNAA